MPDLAATARDILATLIAFDTTSRNSNLELIAWVEDYLERHGVASTRVVSEDASKANLYATVGPDVEGGIILSGHSDVVPVDGQEWHSDPWTVIPLCPVTTFIIVGSPIIASAGFGSFAAISSIIAGAPRQPTSSS